MSLYLCRWPNGDCSIVWARNKEDAITELDQVGNAEGCPLIQMKQFQVHFQLSDEGKLVLESMSEETSEALFRFAYPILEKTLSEMYAEGEGNEETFTPEQYTRIRAAVQQERERVQIDPRDIAEPETELGRDIKQQVGMATPLVNRIVQQTAKQILEDFKGRGKPH